MAHAYHPNKWNFDCYFIICKKSWNLQTFVTIFVITFELLQIQKLYQNFLSYKQEFLVCGLSTQSLEWKLIIHGNKYSQKTVTFNLIRDYCNLYWKKCCTITKVKKVMWKIIVEFSSDSYTCWKYFLCCIYQSFFYINLQRSLRHVAYIKKVTNSSENKMKSDFPCEQCQGCFHFYLSFFRSFIFSSNVWYAYTVICLWK